MDSAWPVAAVGGMLVAFGLILLARTQRAARSIATMDRELLQALGGGVRIGLGLLLLYGAEASAYAPAIRAFGWVLLGVGVVVLAVQTSTFSVWVEGWLRGSLGWRLRLGGALAIVVGGMLLVSAI